VVNSVRDTQEASLLALMFTDAQGQVVFVDNNFLSLMKCPEAGVVVGEPLHRALRADSKVISQLLKDVSISGYVHDREIEVLPWSGDPVTVRCTGVATFDDREGFIGADFTLRDAALAKSDAPQPTHHRDALTTRIKQVHAEATSLESKILLQLYFSTQVSALEILLARLAGPRILHTLESKLNHASELQGVYIKDGHLTFESKDIPADVYYALLNEVIKYSSGVIGRRMVSHELQIVDEQMDAESRRMAEQAGLRQLF
jgi:hypothetical protein